MDVHHDADQSRFVIAASEGEAELQYKRVDDHVLDLIHTHVPKELEHHGFGDALTRAAFAYARANDARVILTCPFVRHWILSHPEERDLVVTGSNIDHQ